MKRRLRPQHGFNEYLKSLRDSGIYDTFRQSQNTGLRNSLQCRSGVLNTLAKRKLESPLVRVGNESELNVSQGEEGYRQVVN